MEFDKQRFTDLVCQYQIGSPSVDEFAEFENWLKTSPEARSVYRRSCRLDTLLRCQSEQMAVPPSAIKSSRRNVVVGAAAAVAALAFALVFMKGTDAATLASSDDAVWQSGDFRTGDSLKSGTRLELESGTVRVLFNSGATTDLTGPASFKVKSENSGYLFSGRAESVAEGERAKGFTIAMPAASVIDVGTAFNAEVNESQDSFISVTDGEVDVAVGGTKRRLLKGMSLSIKYGDPSVIVSLEKGNDEARFKFQSIESPSSNDYADASSGNTKVIIRGRLGLSGKGEANPETINDGRVQRNSFDLKRSFYFKGDEIGSILFDLGKKVPVDRINVYSWDQARGHPNIKLRAFQNYTIWGFSGEEMPDISDTPEVDGWRMICHVDSDEFFGVKHQARRHAQLGCSIEGAAGAIGRFNYLYFDVNTSNRQEAGSTRGRFWNAHTLFGEIDVYVDEP